MKRIVLSIVVLLVLLCGVAVAETTIIDQGNCGASGSNVKWILDSEGTLTIKGEGEMRDYIWSSNGSSNVPWYSNRKSIRTVTIEAGVTSIGSYAFYNCSSLSSITIPAGVTGIKSATFKYCSSLSSIAIPEGVTRIGYDAFSGCSSLSSITIPDGVTSIGDYAFEGCSSLSSITIPDGVTSIGIHTFYNCSKLNSITIPDGMTSIGDSAFYGCSSLKKVYVDSLEGWLNIAFSSYGSNPLYYGGELYIAGELATDLVLPEGVTSIGDYAFSGCSNLSSLTIPDGVTRIGNSAFYGCSSLKKVYVDSLEGWLNIAFLGSASSPLNYGGELYIAGELATDLVIPEGMTRIGNYAFYNCSSLRSIMLPDGVTRIGYDAFYGCSSLSSITIPDGVTSIGSYAFYNCSSLSSITIPEGVTSICDNAFSGCSSLRSITTPEGVTSIGEDAFYKCSSLSSITIPDGVTSIGEGVFYGCSSLRSITIPGGVTSIGNGAFQYCSSLRSITIPDGITSIGNYAFYGCSSLRKVMFLGNDMPTLGSSVFATRLKIYCYEFSAVDFWAAEEGYTCVYIDNMDLSKPISISLPQDMRIEMGESRTISAGLFPQTATAEISWESSDPSVVSVKNGVLTALAIGEATITSSCGDASDRMNVTVYAPVESFELSEAELWIVSKQSAQLDICNIEPVGATAYFTWQSSDTSVLTVDGGRISALKPGDATVTVTSENGIVRSCLVHVCYPATAIELEQSKYQLTAGEDAQITANVTTRNQSYVNRLVKFESSDEAVVTVDQTGRIHAVSVGTATITVAATSGVSAICTVAVEPCTHTPVTDPAVPATHVTTGLTEGSHCSVCGEVLAAQQIVPIVVVEKVVLPAKLEVIEEEAFAGGTFACVVLPDGCKAIGAGAFKNCAQLRFIEIPASVTSIDGSAFEGCSDGLIIVTVSGSEAERFADAQGITCVLR